MPPIGALTARLARRLLPQSPPPRLPPPLLVWLAANLLSAPASRRRRLRPPPPPPAPPKTAPLGSGSDFADLPQELLHRALSAHGRRLKHGPTVPAPCGVEGRDLARRSALGMFQRAARLGSAAAMVDAGLGSERRPWGTTAGRPSWGTLSGCAISGSLTSKLIHLRPRKLLDGFIQLRPQAMFVPNTT
ncbi:uncharacterized protein [Lolium perenne]|uniref:uncharacterized protein n=1 Tax=Lolium perenne TaxID=4522 RepID=UPI003A98D4E6